MVTDIEMGAMQGLIDKCEDKISKKILETAQEMLGDLDADGFESEEKEAEFIEEYGDEINDIVKIAVENNDIRKRMVAEYEILNTFRYGDKEVFMGENPNADKEIERYIVGDIVANELFVRYENCLCSDSYNEIAELYSQRISEQIQHVKDNLAKFPYDRTVIGVDSCDSITDVDLEDKIIVIKPDAIKREYVGADRQLCLATGGNGCSPDGLGRKVFCKNIFTGESVVWLRQDVLGTIKPECIPEWDRIEDTLNCADYYYKEETVAKIKEHGNGAGCHKSIDTTIVPKAKTVDELINTATKTSEEVNKDVVSKNDVDFGKE